MNLTNPRPGCSQDGILDLLEAMLRTYRDELKKARRNLLRARAAGRKGDIFYWQKVLREILTAFGFYGFAVEPIMEAYGIDLAMLGMEE